MARKNYVVEVQHLLLWGLFAGLIEGTVSAVVVSKTFGGSNLLITVVQATPAFANLVSLLWGALFMAMAAACIAAALTIAFTPDDPAGGWIFAAQICLARVFMSGVVTIRASLWKHNYPRSHRARVTAGLQIVRTAVSLPLILGCGALFDWDRLAYQWFYPAISILGALGLLLFRRARVRGERAGLQAGAADGDSPIAEPGLVAPFSLVSLIAPWTIVRRMRDVLRQDTRFARYCMAQFFIGMANLMTMPVNTIIVTKVLALSYFYSNGVLDVIPRLITLAALPLWARWYDRVGVLPFRVVNSVCWGASIAVCGLGAILAAHRHSAGDAWYAAAVVGFAVGHLFYGLGQSGGLLAWNIGHLHFAEDDKAELYMGIHVSLTGSRGLLAPFLGVFLYEWLNWGVYPIAVGLCLVGWLLFARLAREERIVNGGGAAVCREGASITGQAARSAESARR
jgi:hypothetical protein